MIAVERYEPAARDAWDALVSGARQRHFFFERAYMDYHADRFRDASLIVRRDGRPVAALPATRDGDTVVSHGGLTFGGLLSLPELGVERTRAALAAIVERLRADAVRRLVYKPVPHIYHLAPAEEDLYALHDLGASLVRREVSAAIPPGPRPRYSNERRRAVRRGARAGVAVAEDPDVERFMGLVRDVLADRHDVEPVHSADEMRLLASRFPAAIRLWTASAGGELLAGTLIFETPRVAHAQYIANGPRGREHGAGDRLFDHLLRDVYADRWFDFGISNHRSGDLNAGLMRNKEGFGARAVVQDRYELELA